LFLFILALLGGRVDLQDIGAHVGQEHAGQLGRRHAREFQDLDAVEDSH
jgi:hypothetical protein